MKKVFIVSLLAGVSLFFNACNPDDQVDPVDSEKIELTIGDADPILFSGSCMKLTDNKYMLSGNADDDSGLSFTIMWESEEPEGTFEWAADFESGAAGTWLLLANGNLSKSYYSYDVHDGDVIVDRNGALEIEKFGAVDGYVEGAFEITNARLIEVVGSESVESSVKITASFKVSRSS